MSHWSKIYFYKTKLLYESHPKAQTYGGSKEQSLTLNPKIQEPARAHEHTHTQDVCARAYTHMLTLILS